MLSASLNKTFPSCFYPAIAIHSTINKVKKYSFSLDVRLKCALIEPISINNNNNNNNIIVVSVSVVVVVVVVVVIIIIIIVIVILL